MGYPLAYVAFRDLVEQILQDSSNALFTTAQLDDYIAMSLREVSDYVPYLRKETYTIEARYGQATSTLANNLVDATKSQFLLTDVGKVIWNSTDRTWATIKTYTSATTVVLDKDIMASGESYEMFNKYCWDRKHVYIGDITDRLWVETVEYPIGTNRNFGILSGDVLELVTDATLYNTYEVLVTFACLHRISQLTTLTGAVNLEAGYSTGATSMILDTLQTSGTIAQEQEFTIAGLRGLYRVTADATISTGAATISFYPGLHGAVANNTVITFKQATMPQRLELVLADYAAGKAWINKGGSSLAQIAAAIAVLATVSTTIGSMTARIEAASKATTGDIALGRTETAKAVALITTSAAGALAKVDVEVAQALADLDSGRAKIGALASVGNEALEYANYAAGDVTNARAYLNEASGYMQQATADEQLATIYLASASHELSAASQCLNQAMGYMREATARLSVASTVNLYERLGSTKLALALAELRRMRKPKMAKEWARA